MTVASDWALGKLRGAALAFVEHGWPVTRGTYFAGGRWWGSGAAPGLQPVVDQPAADWTVDPVQVAEWWADEPFSILLTCGYGVDCLELPIPTGPKVLDALRNVALVPPAMLTPVRTLVLFVRTSPGPPPLVVSASFRSVGSWLGLPPTGQGSRALRYRWVPGCSPDDMDWRLPELGEVNREITVAVSGMVPAPGTARQQAL